MRRNPITVLLAGVLAGLTGCSTATVVADGGGHPEHKVTGTITYRERIALPPTAVVKVQLVDVSRADAPATVLGEQVIESGGKQVPFSFVIPYDPAQVDARTSYAVQARIEDGGRLLFINDQRYAVVTRGAPDHVTWHLTDSEFLHNPATGHGGRSAGGVRCASRFRLLRSYLRFRPWPPRTACAPWPT